LGYRKRILLNTSSMPLDGAPTTPTWPRDLVTRPPSKFHKLIFRHWSRSRKIVRQQMLWFFLFMPGFGSRERLPPTGADPFF
jgi:hypothetical protein